MPEATQTPTTSTPIARRTPRLSAAVLNGEENPVPAAKRRTETVPFPNLGAELQPTIDRLKALATRGGDALYLSDGRTVPDWQLLDASAEVLSLRKQWKSANDEHHAILSFGLEQITAAGRELLHEVVAEKKRLDLEARRIMRAASKIRATTPAGIYAKALMVRCSGNNARELAKDLADELITCVGLRTALWPAAVPDGASIAGI